MSDSPLSLNSIAWVHYRLRGGMRSVILQSGGFLVIVGGLIIAAVRGDPKDARSILYGWLISLLAIQVGILILYGGSAVRNAVRRDFQTGMIASHRLMPISPSHAVAGYVLGACPQPLAVAGTNLLIGLLIAGPARVNPADWLAANGLLLLFAVCSWVVVVCASLISAKSAGVVLVALVLIFMSGLLTLVPAFTVVCSPLVGSNIFGIVMRGAAWSDVLHLSVIAQLVATTLFFLAAARKYRRYDVPAASPRLGLIIVAYYVAVTLIGIHYWPSLQPVISTITGPLGPLQALASLMLGILVAFLPVGAAAWREEEYRRRRLLDDPALGRRPSNSVELALKLAFLLALIPAIALAEPSLTRNGFTLACLAATLVPLAYLFRLTYRVRATAGLFVGLWIAAVWILPWIVSFGVLVAYGIDDTLELPVAWQRAEAIASFSPIGALISIWTSGDQRHLPGLIFQIIVALLMAVLYHTRRSGKGELYVPVAGSK